MGKTQALDLSSPQRTLQKDNEDIYPFSSLISLILLLKKVIPKSKKKEDLEINFPLPIPLACEMEVSVCLWSVLSFHLLNKVTTGTSMGFLGVIEMLVLNVIQI